MGHELHVVLSPVFACRQRHAVNCWAAFLLCMGIEQGTSGSAPFSHATAVHTWGHGHIAAASALLQLQLLDAC
jgi:hypothetical protein